MNLSFYTYYMMNYFKKTEEENRHILMNLMFFLTLSNIVVIIIAVGIISLYFSFFNVEFPVFPYIIFVLGTAFAMVYKAFFLLKFKMMKKGLNYFLFSALLIIVNISLGLLFVVKFQLGAKGKQGALFLANFIFGIIAYKILYSKFNYDFRVIKNAFKVCYPLIISAFLTFPVSYIDKILLERQHNITEFGLYNIGGTMAGYLLGMSQALFMAFEPDIYKYVIQRNKKRVFQVLALFIGIIIIISVIFVFSSKYIIGFLTSWRYTEAYRYANFHVCANLFAILFQALITILVALQRTKLILFNKIIMSSVSIFIYIILINKWQFFGSLYARITIFFLMSLLVLTLIKTRSSNFFRKLKLA